MAMAAAAAIAAACGHPEPPVTSFPAVRTDTEIVLPLDSYFVAGEDLVLIDRAFDILVRNCINGFGLEWASKSSDDSTAPPTSQVVSRRYGLISAEQAAMYGYSLPPDSAGQGWGGVAASPAPAPHPSPNNDAEAVFSGAVESYNGQPVPAGGCFADSQRRLDEGAPPFDAYGLVAGMQGEASDRAEKDSRVQEAWERWSDCMAKKGFDYATPWDASDDRQWANPKNEAREIATATADVACREETNLVGIWYAVDVAYHNQLIEENTQELDTLRQLIEAQKRNAARIIAGG